LAVPIANIHWQLAQLGNCRWQFSGVAPAVSPTAYQQPIAKQQNCGQQWESEF
jgi:hypothetical protein